MNYLRHTPIAMLLLSAFVLAACSKQEDPEPEEELDIREYKCECLINDNSGPSREQTLLIESTPETIEQDCDDLSTQTDFGKTCTWSEGW